MIYALYVIVGNKIMMKSTKNMFWGDINDITRFSENTRENKKKEARKTSSIILASIQLMENYIKGIKQMNAYDASSTILCDSNWVQKSSIKTFNDKNGKKISIELGKVYYIDYGKTFYGELAYFHYGLCIGKRNEKILMVPIRSGNDIFSSSYHPINNPKADKKYRQGLQTEGFQKDCVLLINDLKFISAGRIDKECVFINENILKSIQTQVFQVTLPNLYTEFSNNQKNIQKYEKQIRDQKELIQKIKSENNSLKQKLENLGNKKSLKTVDSHKVL